MGAVANWLTHPISQLATDSQMDYFLWESLNFESRVESRLSSFESGSVFSSLGLEIKATCLLTVFHSIRYPDANQSVGLAIRMWLLHAYFFPDVLAFKYHQAHVSKSSRKVLSNLLLYHPPELINRKACYPPPHSWIKYQAPPFPSPSPQRPQSYVPRTA